MMRGHRVPDAAVRASSHASINPADELDEIALRCAALPVLDERSEDDILGYDVVGLPLQDNGVGR